MYEFEAGGSFRKSGTHKQNKELTKKQSHVWRRASTLAKKRVQSRKNI